MQGLRVRVRWGIMRDRRGSSIVWKKHTVIAGIYQVQRRDGMPCEFDEGAWFGIEWCIAEHP